MTSSLRAETRGQPSADQKLKNRLRYAGSHKLSQQLNKKNADKSLLRKLGLPIEVVLTRAGLVAEARLKHWLEKKKENKINTNPLTFKYNQPYKKDKNKKAITAKKKD